MRNTDNFIIKNVKIEIKKDLSNFKSKVIKSKASISDEPSSEEESDK